MSDKIFAGIIILLVGGTIGVAAVAQQNRPNNASRPGVEQADKGSKHVEATAVKEGAPEPPVSGSHAVQPVPWQNYNQEIPDANSIHNLEHGGVYVSYRPDLPADQIAAIKSLFFQPYSRGDFKPVKAIAAPRQANSAPIIMSSWNRNMKLDTFDMAKMIEYYNRNVGKSPEAGAS